MKRTILLCLLLTTTLTVAARRTADTSATLRVACVGNSITYGIGVENRETNCYPAVLERLLGPGYEVRNFGHSGATLLNKGHNPYTRTPEYTAALAYRPDIVVIHLGINDTDPRNWPHYRDEFIPDYAALIARFREANPAVRVYVCRMTPIAHRHPRFKAGTRDWHQQIQEAIEIVAQSQHTGLIDLESVLKPRPELIPDAVHPNAEGAQLIAERVYSAITGDFGKLRMSPVYTDNMVLQRGHMIRVGGVANAGRLVTVTLSDQVPGTRQSRRAPAPTLYATDTVTAGEDGKWEMHLQLHDPILSAVLTISTPDTTAIYRNVGVGEVWIASGQSNMSWPVINSAERHEARPNARIRLFRTNPTFAQEGRGPLDSTELYRLNQLDYIRNPQGWVPASDTAAMEAFSAVAWFFGQMLADSLGPQVPIGLIQTSLGGATAEGFVARNTLENDPALVDLLYDWRNNEMTGAWVRSVIQKNLQKVSNPLQRHYFEPAYLYESRIAPLAAGYDVQGFIWYQGESNAEFPELHEKIFPAVVKSFREAFDRNYPGLKPSFYFVQLSSLNRPSWPEFRDSQRQLEKSLYWYENVLMAVSSDLGDSTDVHPRHKKPIGERLALKALAREYRHNIPDFESPQCVDILRHCDTLILTFSQPLTTLDGEAPRTFEIASHNGIYHPAKALIDGKRVYVIDSEATLPPPSVSGPSIWVRYGWQPYTRANLCGAGPHKQPVSTFRKRCQVIKLY